MQVEQIFQMGARLLTVRYPYSIFFCISSASGTYHFVTFSGVGVWAPGK